MCPTEKSLQYALEDHGVANLSGIMKQLKKERKHLEKQTVRIERGTRGFRWCLSRHGETDAQTPQDVSEVPGADCRGGHAGPRSEQSGGAKS